MTSSSSPNQRALRRLIALAILSGLVVIALFFAIEERQIASRATHTLSVYASAPWQDFDKIVFGKISPAVSIISLEESEAAALTELGQGLLAYVERERDTLTTGEIECFRSGQLCAYYFIRESGDDTLILYSDVSFARDIVRSAALIMALVFSGIAAVLYLCGRSTIRLLDRKDQSMRDFFANASHELKTPLMTMQSYADGLERGLVSQEKALRVIDREGTRMAHLINGILVFSKLDSGILQPARSDCDLREILYDALQSIETAASQRGLKLTPALNEPLHLYCDEALLYSVFSNILSNSLRYAAQEIRLSASQDEEAFILTFANDGPPLSSDECTHIFERFYKGHDGQSGLGLSLSLEYVRLHGGTITAYSKDGWTYFTVRLPR